VARALDGAAPNPVAVEIREPTLDDVFFALTGKQAGKETPAQETPAQETPAKETTVRGAA
jgi:hypothetical protein